MDNSTTATLPTLADWAIFLRRLGLGVFPLQPRAKTPALRRWLPYQSELANEEQILRWWEKNPTFNIGIPTGEVSGFDVIDADAPEAIELVLASLPHTPFQVSTAKGRHFYFKNTGRRLRNSVRIHGQAIDCRSFGGYVVGPGSIHESGHRYLPIEPLTPFLLQEVPPLDPKWFAIEQKFTSSTIEPSPADPVKRAALYISHIEGAVEGNGGSNVTMRVAGILIQKFGLSVGQALPLFILWNMKCSPPWSERELSHKLDSAVKNVGSQKWQIIKRTGGS